ncbi:MAG: hypothetical protein SCALA701_06740 [Candidatus Scalindua sp.]|nr:MAG: hypothetical protein SCALA701_06740 [Candidatus Scalindua sp.]
MSTITTGYKKNEYLVREYAVAIIPSKLMHDMKESVITHKGESPLSFLVTRKSSMYKSEKNRPVKIEGVALLQGKMKVSKIFGYLNNTTKTFFSLISNR